MSVQELNNLTVLGAGVLGGQIAWQSAFKGKSVVVYDLAADFLDVPDMAQAAEVARLSLPKH